jgi:hypothetical protein
MQPIDYPVRGIGHFAGNGSWHAGKIDGCPKCPGEQHVSGSGTRHDGPREGCRVCPTTTRPGAGFWVAAAKAEAAGLDTSSSRSRQHWIDTGEFLRPDGSTVDGEPAPVPVPREPTP